MMVISISEKSRFFSRGTPFPPSIRSIIAKPRFAARSSIILPPRGWKFIIPNITGFERALVNSEKVTVSADIVDFNPATGQVGSKIDTLFHAGDSASVSFPRVSPNGKTLVFTKHGFGNFSIWHRDSDLYGMDLSSGSVRPLAEANAPGVDSYHSWSSNSRFLVFASRRLDGLYTRLYMTYVDENGVEHKPFLLPQRNPKKYYDDLMFSYNIPEFVKGKVKVDRQRIGRTMRTSSGTNLSFRESSD